MLTTSHPTGLPPRPLSPRRARIALVLGSGGVRSAGAIGAAEVLAGEGLAPDLLVGCSSGALFGAVLALGLPATEAMERVRRLWTADLTEQRRWWSWVQLALPRWTGFGPGFALRDSRRIARRVAEGVGQGQLEDLSTPLRVVATDAATGARVLLTRGPLVDSVCASMALPLVFPPVSIGSRLLVDGVISDPLPVSAAADADVVLTLGFAGLMPRRVDRPSRLFGRVSTAVLNNLMQARMDAARAAGQNIIELELDLGRHVGLWETAGFELSYRAGQEAARQALPELRQALERAALVQRTLGRAAR